MEKDTTGFDDQDGLPAVLKELIAEVIPRDTIVVFRAPESELKAVANFIHNARSHFARYGCLAIACPDSIDVITLPAGTAPERIELKKKETPDVRTEPDPAA